MGFTNGTTWGVVYLVTEWLIRFGMLIFVPFRRSPEAAKGWLLLVFFLPWPGLLLYFVIGRPTYPRWPTERFLRLPRLFRPILDRLDSTMQKFRISSPDEMPAIAVLVQNLGNLRLLRANTVALLTDYDGAIDRLVADIDEARNHVHLLYYIFADDAAGMKVVLALERAVERGVTCRVLVDYLGSRRWGRSLDEKLAAAGVQVCRMLRVGLPRLMSARADLRNHRKIAVIDGRIGYTGSQNLVHAGFKRGMTFEELVVRVTGPVVLQLQAVFVSDWFIETEEMLDSSEVAPEPTGPGAVVAQVLPSGPDYPATNVQRLVVALVHAAQQRIAITTPYFIPDDPLLVAMETAVRRGVEVHLVVSRIADQILVSLAQKSYYEQLLDAGIHIYLYREKFLHSKHLSIDGVISVIGSSNMDLRSFVLNAEVSLVVYNAEVAAELRAQEERYFAASDRLSQIEWMKRSLAEKICENLARLMSPLL